MQYIQTKYLHPTSTQGGRIKAQASYGGNSVTIAYDHSLDAEQAHAKAAMALARKLGWAADYLAGGNSSGYVFVIDAPARRYASSYQEGQ